MTDRGKKTVALGRRVRNGYSPADSRMYAPRRSFDLAGMNAAKRPFRYPFSPGIETSSKITSGLSSAAFCTAPVPLTAGRKQPNPNEIPKRSTSRS